MSGEMTKLRLEVANLASNKIAELIDTRDHDTARYMLLYEYGSMVRREPVDVALHALATVGNMVAVDVVDDEVGAQVIALIHTVEAVLLGVHP